MNARESEDVGRKMCMRERHCSVIVERDGVKVVVVSWWLGSAKAEFNLASR